MKYTIHDLMLKVFCNIAVKDSFDYQVHLLSLPNLLLRHTLPLSRERERAHLDREVGHDGQRILQYIRKSTPVCSFPHKTEIQIRR